MTMLLLVVIVVLSLTAYMRWHPIRETPRYKFNSIVPRLLDTGAVTILGWCFVRRHIITAHHRAHEEYHHQCAYYQGRWKHLGRYLLDFFRGLLRYRFQKVEGPTRRYLAAYWLHPEEVAARAAADANAHRYQDIGIP